MRIAIVTDAWLPQVNGVVTTYLKTIEILRGRGHTVMVISPQLFPAVPCPTYPEIPLSLATASKIRGMLRSFAPHSVHIATEGPLGWAARRVCRRDDLCFTTSYHTRFPEYIRLRLPVPLALGYHFMKRFHRASERIMVSSPQLRQELQARGFGTLCLWSRGVDTDLFKPVTTGADGPEKNYFTYLGRVAPEKNIEAFLRLDLPGPKMVIGDGPILETLRERYPDTRFTGLKKGEELVSLLNLSRVFVFPSLTDTLGVVQLEAMACGLPVAAYPADGPKALIINGHNGWMDEDLETAIHRCLDISPDNCRAFALNHTWDACTDQFVANLAMVQQYCPAPELLLAEAG